MAERSISFPVTPVIPPTVTTGQKITSSHENSVVQCLSDLWTDVQAVGAVSVSDPTSVKGDMLARGASALSRLVVGSNGQMLVANSAAALGVNWATVTAATVGAAPTSRLITTAAGSGLSGGGDLSADRSLAADVKTVFGRTGAVVLTTADVTGVNGVVTSGSYANPAWITAIDWSVISSKPATFPPSAHTHAAADVISGVFAVARLGTGTPSTANYLRGDGAWNAIAAGDVASGVFPPARLGTGTPSTSNFLRGDGAWTATPGILDPTTAKGDLLVRSATAVSALAVSTDGFVLMADSAQTLGVKWAAAGAGTQTPWLTDINAATFRLFNAGNIGIGVATAAGIPISSAVAGRAYLTVKGASDGGVIEVATGAADADAALAGMLAFTDPINNQTDKRLGSVYMLRSGATANNRGAALIFATRSDNSTIGAAERMRIDNAGNIGIGTTTIPVSPGATNRRYLTIKGPSDAGMLELAHSAADSDGQIVGQVCWTDSNSTNADKRVVLINSILSGSTANNRGGALYINTKADGGALAERMRIDNAGNVGIGTTTVPIYSGATAGYTFLSIKGSTGYAMVELAGGQPDAAGNISGVFAFSDTARTGDKRISQIFAMTDGTTANNRGGALVFQTRSDNGATVGERMRITNQGRVGIGVTNPGASLECLQEIYTTVSTATWARNWIKNPTNSCMVGVEGGGGTAVVGSTANAAFVTSVGAYPLQFGASNTVAMTIQAGGSVGIALTDTTRLGQAQLVVASGGNQARYYYGATNQCIVFYRASGYASIQSQTDSVSFDQLTLNGSGGQVTIGSGGSRLVISTPTFIANDTDLINGSVSFYLNEGGNLLGFKVKYSNGTIKSGSVALS